MAKQAGNAVDNKQNKIVTSGLQAMEDDTNVSVQVLKYYKTLESYERKFQAQKAKATAKVLIAQLKFEAKLASMTFKDEKTRQKWIESEKKKLAKLALKESNNLAYQEKLIQKLMLEEEFAERKLMIEDEAKRRGASFKDNIDLMKQSLKTEGGVLQQTSDALHKSGQQAFANTVKKASLGVDDAMTLFSGSFSKMNARLQGSGKMAMGVTLMLESNLAVSPFVLFADAYNNVASLIEQGIAFNVEQRGFLNTIKDKIADTFDAANGTLLLIIRIQQEDSTKQRLGMEASLTKFLNKNFQDTSYLTDVYDTVTTAVADSVVLLGTSKGAEYEFNILKWLSSLYSLGVSSDTLTNLASAVNMLALGDVSGLENSGLLNLLVMAANKSNISYGDLLTKGVNAENIDILMSNVVAYWLLLASNTNQVVRKQYTELFGLNMGDLVAIKNLTSTDVNKIMGNDLTYRGMEVELATLLVLIPLRMHISEMINNAYENAIGGVGRLIANNPAMMATWLINDLIKDATGGINIPFINAMGFGLDMNTDVNSLIELGMVGIGTLGLIGNVISSLASGGGLNLAAWGASDVTRHGKGMGAVVEGVTTTTSSTTYIGNSEGSDIYKSTLNAAYDNVDTSVSSEQQEQADEMKTAMTEHIKPDVAAILELLRSVKTGSALRVKIEDYGLTLSFGGLGI